MQMNNTFEDNIKTNTEIHQLCINDPNNATENRGCE